jgi:DNA-binding CsgD family transcriptional regulator
MDRLLELEYGGADVNQFGALARLRRPVATLGTATGGNNHASGRYRDVLAPEGVAHELRAVFRDASGTWGGLVLFRHDDTPDFNNDEMALVAGVADDVTRAIRRVLLLAEIEAKTGAQAPALLLLEGKPALAVRYASPTAAAWIDEIDDGTTEQLPYSLYSLAARARSTGVPAVARLRTRAGRWLTAHAECLHDGTGGVSLILEPSRPHEIAHVLAAAYGLTPREVEVVRLVATGCANTEIAQLLFVSRYTVEDHLKRLYDKLSVNSRSGLVSKLFFDQYLPRTRAGEAAGGTGWFMANGKGKSTEKA